LASTPFDRRSNGAGRKMDPLLRPLVEVVTAAPAPPSHSMAEARVAANERSRLLLGTFYDRGPEPASTAQHSIAVDGGQIMVRVYHPGGHGPFPAHLYIHGGAFCFGSTDSCDSPCREICCGAGAVVVSVDYRLAPEHKFPTAVEDCYAALQWLYDSASSLQVDLRRISIGGESAGGGLAASVSLVARDRGGPSLVMQLLGIPFVDLTVSQPSTDEFGTGYMLLKSGLLECAAHYLPDNEDAHNPYASPLFAKDLSGVPPAIVMTMEFDPLRDEGEALARRLVEAGVPTLHKRWLGHIHGSALFTRLLPSAEMYRDFLVASLRRAYTRTPEAVQ
jgi:acetyl esterase